MDLSSYLRAVRRRWWLVVAILVLGLLGAYVVNERATPFYASHVTFYVSTPASTDSSAFAADQFAQRRTNSYVELLSSQSLAEQIIKSSDLDVSSGQLRGEIKGSAQINTVLLVATVKDASPSRALKIARLVATTFPSLIDSLDNRGTGQTTVELHVVTGPTVSSSPVSPRKNLTLFIGLLGGLLVGLLLAVVRELTDNTVRTAKDIQDVSGWPTLSSIRYDASARRAPLLLDAQLHSARAEAMRQLRTNLQFVNVDDPVGVIAVTSSVAGEGKSTTATNLAIISAKPGRRVLIVEADLRRPRVTEYLGLERAVGLTNVLAGQVAFVDVVQAWGTDGLDVLPAGSIPPNPSELLGSRNMAELVAELRGRYDLVIIDTPPLLPVTDAAVVSALTDGILIVVRHGKTTRAQLFETLRLMESVQARVLGTVLNMQRVGRLRSQGYETYGYHADTSDDLDGLLTSGTDVRSVDGSNDGPVERELSEPAATHAEGHATADGAGGPAGATSEPESALAEPAGTGAVPTDALDGARPRAASEPVDLHADKADGPDADGPDALDPPPGEVASVDDPPQEHAISEEVTGRDGHDGDRDAEAAVPPHGAVDLEKQSTAGAAERAPTENARSGSVTAEVSARMDDDELTATSETAPAPTDARPSERAPAKQATKKSPTRSAASRTRHRQGRSTSRRSPPGP